MARKNKGTVKQGGDGLFYGRVRWTDEEKNEPREKKFPGQKTDSDAWKLVHKFKDDLDSKGTKGVNNENRTFQQLADEYSKTYLIPAEYRHGIKTSGLRSLAAPTGQLKILRDFFNRKKLRHISYPDIRQFQDQRLKTPKRGGGDRCVASVNRELALLRRMLNFGWHELHWLTNNPFNDGKALISNAAERKRERTLTREEEQRLLEQCTGRRKHLRAIVICLLDTGCRKSELLQTRWSDVDLTRREIFIPMMNTKTAREKKVPVSHRMQIELEKMWRESGMDLDAQVFGLTDIKRAFDSARKGAGLEDARIHDLRHTYASRMARNRVPVAELARLLGHATLEMTFRYINSDEETLGRAREIVDEMNTVPAPSTTRVIEVETVN
jgi:integrase